MSRPAVLTCPGMSRGLGSTEGPAGAKSKDPKCGLETGERRGTGNVRGSVGWSVGGTVGGNVGG